jgi:hypothetical protein
MLMLWHAFGLVPVPRAKVVSSFLLFAWWSPLLFLVRILKKQGTFPEPVQCDIMHKLVENACPSHHVTHDDTQVNGHPSFRIVYYSEFKASVGERVCRMKPIKPQ